MSDLTTVNNTLKEQNELLKGDRAQELENIREKDRKDAEMLKILRDLKPTVNIDGKESKGGFLKAVLTGLGLIGTGAIALAGGLAAGWVVYVGALIKDIGKIVKAFFKAIPKPKWVDEIFDVLKKVGGNMFTKIKNFFVGEAGFMKRIGKIIDGMIDAVKNFTGGIFTRISNFFVGEAGFMKRITKIADGVFDTLKGFTGGAFTKIAAPFKWLRVNTTTGSVIGDMIDGVMKIFKTGAGEGGFIARLFGGIKSVFSSLSNIGSVLMAPFDAIKGVFGVVGKTGGGILDVIMGFIRPFKSVFVTFARLGAKLAAPLSIILGLFDAGFETKDAVEKSEGFFASILNGIFGAIGGFIDGAILQVADLLKDGISWIAGFFGFTEIEKTLDSFSFSEIFNKFLDGVYEFVNKMFNNPMAILRDIANSILGETITNRLFGEDTGAEKTKLEKKLAEVQNKEIKERSGRTVAYTQENKNEEIAKLMAEIKALTPKAATGGLISSAGIYNLHKGEMVMDEIAVKGFEKALNLVNMSQQNAQASGGGTVVVNNNNNVDNSVKSAAKTNFNSAVATRTNESTVRALQMTN